MAATSSASRASSIARSASSATIRRPRTLIAVLVANTTGSPPVRGRRLAASSPRWARGTPARRSRRSSGPQNPRWRIWFSAAILASRAERRATTNARIASMLPSRLLGWPAARPDSAARAASIASAGSDLPVLRRAGGSGGPPRPPRHPGRPGTGRCPPHTTRRPRPPPAPDDPDRTTSRTAGRDRPCWSGSSPPPTTRRSRPPPRPRSGPSGCPRPPSPDAGHLRSSPSSLPFSQWIRDDTSRLECGGGAIALLEQGNPPHPNNRQAPSPSRSTTLLPDSDRRMGYQVRPTRQHQP